MKYEELIKVLEGLWHDSFKIPAYKALLDVAKFHKPFDFKLGDGNFTSCEGCGEADYPCPTILVICNEIK
jgi:hypothetical protein